MSSNAVMKNFDLHSLRKIYNVDLDRIALAKKRQVALFKGEKPDAWPICLTTSLNEEQEGIPSANYDEAFHDNALMLCQQVRWACAAANSRSDIVPSIRANLGTGICAALVGLAQQTFTDKMPWLKDHLSVDAAAELTVDDVRIQGDFNRGLQQMKLFKEIMGDSLNVFCMDTQGPFDLCHLLIGDELFYAIYDEPEKVHRILDLCTDLLIKAHEVMKDVSGEPRDHVAHSNFLYSENMGIRICEDTTAIVSSEVMEEFALPYTRRLAAHFGGAWVHYCGRNDELTRQVLEAPEIRAINFGFFPGNAKQQHDFEADFDLIEKHGKLFVGSWPKENEESIRDYLKRLHSKAAKGCILPVLNAGELIGPDGFADVEEIKDFWYSL